MFGHRAPPRLWGLAASSQGSVGACALRRFSVRTQVQMAAVVPNGHEGWTRSDSHSPSDAAPQAAQARDGNATGTLRAHCACMTTEVIDMSQTRPRVLVVACGALLVAGCSSTQPTAPASPSPIPVTTPAPNDAALSSYLEFWRITDAAGAAPRSQDWTPKIKSVRRYTGG